jgi:hypothetical protein
MVPRPSITAAESLKDEFSIPTNRIVQDGSRAVGRHYSFKSCKNSPFSYELGTRLEPSRGRHGILYHFSCMLKHRTPKSAALVTGCYAMHHLPPSHGSPSRGL